jgi:hypothetical protein
MSAFYHSLTLGVKLRDIKAYPWNFKLQVLYSRYWNMYSTGVNAFTVDWHGVNGLFVHHLFLISRVLY